MTAPETFRLPSFFHHHMVLQRDKPVRIFGWAKAGSTIQIELASLQASTCCARGGRWLVEMPSLPAGGPHMLMAKCGRRTLRFEDIYVGDLWFCSGQSNMAFPVSRSRHAAAAIRAAALPKIRHFKVEQAAAVKPANDVQGQWVICDPKTVGDFTAVGFYFARRVQKRIQVPLGIIHSSWGSTPIEAWIPSQSYRSSPALQPLARMEAKLQRPGPMLAAAYKKWEREQVSADPGNEGEKKGWHRRDWDDRNWGEMKVPGFWEGQGLAIDGAVWFRHTVDIPAAWNGRELRLDLGPIDDFDETYFNGTKVGATGPESENPHRIARSYLISGRLVASSSVCLAVRIFDRFGSGGFIGKKEMLKLSCPERPRDRPVPLAGKWRFQVEWKVDRPNPVPQPPVLPEPRARLSRLFNGMVHAFRQLPIKGFLWYQGESNAYRAAHYRESFPILIQSWRSAWKENGLPFYFVQLANFKSPPPGPIEDFWAELREAQAQALQLDGTAMAVAIDVGEEGDIHPRDKRSVGERLALLALARNYGDKFQDSGPTLTEAMPGKGKVTLKFTNVGMGLKTSDGKTPRGFALAEEGGGWVWAHARIHDPNIIVLRASGLRRPTLVRYAWAVNPGTNLFNSQGLPAAPFRTDQRPFSTEGHLWPF